MSKNGYDPRQNFTQEELDELVAKSPYYKATANDVDWVMKVRMQGRIQKWVDHSISVTINLPASATEELVAELYAEAWRCGCKGVTVYRDGCRSGSRRTRFVLFFGNYTTLFQIVNLKNVFFSIFSGANIL